MEGARLKQLYRLRARRHGLAWAGRRYDRQDPTAADPPIQEINHASTCVEAAVAATATIPQLGFIHEDSGNSFVLDVADLYRATITLSLALEAAKACERRPERTLEREVRQQATSHFRKGGLIPAMINWIEELFDGGDRHP